MNKTIKKYVIALTICLFVTGCSTRQPDQAKLCPLYATISTGHIEYYQIGSGSPIVLIAGYATDVTSWNRDFLAALAKQHRLIILNNRNVGSSRVSTSHYDSRDMANDVAQLIQHLQLKKPSVLGISMGGMIAQQVAVSHAKETGSLILINTAIAGKKGVRPAPDIEKSMLNIPPNKLGFYSVAVRSFFPTEWKARMASSLMVDRFQPALHHDIDLSAVMPEQRRVILKWADDNVTAKKIQNVNMPTLILNGRADRVIPPINSEILATNIPHATLRRWRDGGHAMIYQYPKEMAEVINQFLASVT
tara:strand:+ start:90 stop:1004 length:915 start_codon:yes stop_codon:yes gene_type:complete